MKTEQEIRNELARIVEISIVHKAELDKLQAKADKMTHLLNHSEDELLRGQIRVELVEHLPALTQARKDYGIVTAEINALQWVLS